MGCWSLGSALGNDTAADEVFDISRDTFLENAEDVFESYFEDEDDEEYEDLAYFYACAVALSTGREGMTPEVCLGTLGYGALDVYRVVSGLDASSLYKTAKKVLKKEIIARELNDRKEDLNRIELCIKALEEGYNTDKKGNLDIDEKDNGYKVCEDFDSDYSSNSDIAGKWGLYQELCILSEDFDMEYGYTYLYDSRSINIGNLKDFSNCVGKAITICMSKANFACKPWEVFGEENIKEGVLEEYEELEEYEDLEEDEIFDEIFKDGSKSLFEKYVCHPVLKFSDKGDGILSLIFEVLSEEGQVIDFEVSFDKDCFIDKKIKIVGNKYNLGKSELNTILVYIRKLIVEAYSRYSGAEFEEVVVFFDTNSNTQGVGHFLEDTLDYDRTLDKTWSFGDKKPHCRLVVTLKE